MQWQMTGSIVDAANHVGQQPQVEVKESTIDNVPKTISVVPISVNIYQFPVAGAGQ